jgi:hypothetical protein
MSHADLLAALETIRHELGHGENLDPSEVEKLRETVRDIEGVLRIHDSESLGLTERLSESASHFEESHPKLTLTLGRIADMLQQMGF